jgi:hypothetical protein
MAIKLLEELLKMSPRELRNYLQSLAMAERQKVRDLLEGKVDLEALDHLDPEHPN